MQPLISIIVPVYNVETYLNRCMESIIAQTIEDIEIIVVDDGSTDASGRMCDEWAVKDNRIVVVHKTNGGLTDAWKTGVQASHGEYLGFVDSDDFIDVIMYENLYEEAVKDDSDIVVCGLVFAFENTSKEERKENSKFNKKNYERNLIVQELFPTLINDGSFFGRRLQAARVTKLFKRKIVLDNLKYCNEKVSVGEDLQLTFSAFCDANKVSYLADFYPYHYWINNASITGKHDPDYLDKIIRMKNQIEYINQEKDVFDFSGQISNDFVSLVVLATKNEICKNKTDDRRTVIRNIKKICEHHEVKKALKEYQMPELRLTEKLYLCFMKCRLYNLCYYAVKIFLG